MNYQQLGEHTMSIFKNMFSSADKCVASVITGLLSIFAPVWVPITAVGILILLDAIYGYKVSKKYGHPKIESHKAWKTIWKTRDAAVAITSASIIDQLVVTSINLHAVEIVAGMIALVEFWSLLESFNDLYPKWKIWKILKKVIKAKERNIQIYHQIKNYQMIPILNQLVNWFTRNFRAVAVGLVSLLIATVFVQNHQLQKKNKEIDRITNNVRAYEQLASQKEQLNRVLQLTIEELNTSNDSLLKEAKDAQKKLKIKDKNLTDVNVINTEIKDSVRTIIKHKLIDFDEELKINPLTTIIVSRKDSILKATLDIKNQQILFVEEKKEYKNKYRNGFVRFFHFDWKRIRTKNIRQLTVIR